MRTLGMLFVWIGGLLVGLSFGYMAGSHRHLDYAQRQAIAIDFMCGPEQHWKGMKMFCGDQVMDGRVKNQKD